MKHEKDRVAPLTEQESMGTRLSKYLQDRDPIGISTYPLTPLPAAEYHLNFKLISDKGTYVVRMSSLHLSRKNDQLAQEYAYLEYLSQYDNAPKPYFLDLDGFDHPFLIEEFIEGETFNELSNENLLKCAEALVSLYKTPLIDGHPFEVRTPSYTEDLNYYRGVYAEYEGADEIAHWAEHVEIATHQVRDSLHKLEPLLNVVEPRLIRRDANPRNLIDTGDAFTWVDWEVARVDDPVITLASFINETELYDWFTPKLTPDQREVITKYFLDATDLQNGRELLQARLILERYWGMIWAIERIYMHKKGELPEHLSTNERLERYEFIARESHRALEGDLEKKTLL